MGKTLDIIEHPAVSRALRLGDGDMGVPRCRGCGDAAEVEKGGECLCRECALDRWYLLPESRRLELLGFEPTEQ